MLLILLGLVLGSAFARRGTDVLRSGDVEGNCGAVPVVE